MEVMFAFGEGGQERVERGATHCEGSARNRGEPVLSEDEGGAGACWCWKCTYVG